MKIEFAVEGQPCAYSRDSVVKRRTSPEEDAWRRDVAMAFRRAMPRDWPEGAYLGRVWVRALVYGSAADADNLCKPILDALTGHAWKDDRQVVSLTIDLPDRGLSKKGAPTRAIGTMRPGAKIVIEFPDWFDRKNGVAK